MATCVVSGTFLDPKSAAISGATVRFNLDKPAIDASGNLLMPKEVTTTTAGDGTWSLTLTQNMSGVLTLDLTPSANASVVKYKFSLVIPVSATSTFASCWADSSGFGGQSVTSPFSFSSVAGSLATSQLPVLPSADIWVGSAGGQAAATPITGDISLSNTGVVAVNTVGASSSVNVHSAELLANAATNLNTASTIVKRDSSGNFSAGTINATLAGNATSATSATSATTAGTASNFSGSLSGDVSGSQTTTAVSKIMGTIVGGTTGSGNVAFSASPAFTSPTVGTQSQTDSSTLAASTAYVTTAIANAVAGVNPSVAVQAATTAASDTSSLTYNNGVSGIGATFLGSVNTALVVDGFTFTVVGQRLLVKNDTQSPSGAFNGIYNVTQLQTGILAPVLTRALDYDQASDINNTGAIPVINGTVNGTTSWVETSSITNVGADALTFAKFTRNPADYLLVSNNLSDVNTKATAFNNLSPMTSVGDTIYGGTSGTGTRLAANATGTNKFLAQASSAAPAWTALAAADLVNAVTPGSSGNVLTSNGSTWTSALAGSTPIVSAIANINAFYAFS